MPEVSVIIERRVRMAREGNCIGIAVQYLGHIAVVSAPCPWTIAGVEGMGMLDVEERLLGSQLVSMPADELTQAGNIVVMPMSTDEVIAIDLLHPYGRIVLQEACFPRCSNVLDDGILAG